jgi:drug/metabolite transporter (DMT)-like permease
VAKAAASTAAERLLTGGALLGGPLLGGLALLATATLWGSNHVVARGSTEIVPLAAFVFWRWAAALPILIAVAWPGLCRDWPVLRERWRDLLLLGTIGVGLFSVLLIAGAYYSLAIEVGIISSSTPAWVAVIVWLKGRERIAASTLAGLAVAFAGAMLVVTRGEPAAVLGLGAGIGNLYVLASAILFAWFTTRLRPYRDRIASLSLTTATATAGTLTVLLPTYLVWLAFGGEPYVTTGADAATALLILAYAAIAPTLLANAFYIFGVSRLGPQRAAAFLYLTPIASAAMAVAFLGEALAWYHALGFVLVMAGLLLVSRATPRAPDAG